MIRMLSPQSEYFILSTQPAGQFIDVRNYVVPSLRVGSEYSRGAWRPDRFWEVSVIRSNWVKISASVIEQEGVPSNWIAVRPRKASGRIRHPFALTCPIQTALIR